jgi:putative spermidine/putrescine transport system permease protein
VSADAAAGVPLDVGNVAARARRLVTPRFLLAAAPTLFYLVFLVAPVIELVDVSLHTDAISGPQPISWQGYASVLTSQYYRHAWLVSIQLAAITSVITVALAVGLAVLLARTPARIRAYVLFLVVTPLLVSGVVRDYGWLAVGAPGAPLDRVAALFGTRAQDVLFHPAGVILAFTNVFLPLALLAIFGRLTQIPANLHRAAASLGGNPLRSFATVTLPLIAGSIWNTAALLFCLSMAAYDVPQILGGGRVVTVAQAIFEAENVTYDQQTASALGITLIVLVLAVLLLIGLLPAVVRRVRRFAQLAASPAALAVTQADAPTERAQP